MIVKNKMSWVRQLLHVRGSSLTETWPRIAMATLIAVVVTFVELRFGIERYTFTTTPFALIGVALGIILGFRNDAAYDRFWEGRTLWGSLVNTSRSLTRQAFSLIGPEANSTELTKFRQRFVRRTIAFAHALRHHLRDTDPLEDIEPLLPPAEFAAVRAAGHRPVAILQQLGHDVAQAHGQGWLAEVNMPAVDGQLVELSNILGGCERIKNTPIPFTYTVLIHRIVAFYCFLLPLGLVDTTGILTPVVVLLISYAFFGLDDLGQEIEDPFGTEPNNLPLEDISRKIEINLCELLGDADLPKPLEPINGVLL